MTKFLRNCKSFTLAALTLASTTLSGIIFSVKSPQEVCTRLDKALAQTSPTEITWIFVDIDDTLIKSSSDYDSFRKTGTYEQMQIVNEPLIQRLREFGNHPFVKTVALTSAKTWGIDELDEENITLNAVPSFFPGNEILSASEIRAGAMASLSLPFETAFGTSVRKLPFVTQPVTLSEEIRAKLQPLYLPPELQRERYFSDSNVFLYTCRVPFRMAKQELYRKASPGATGDLAPKVSAYERITGWPVYENGVIFSNFFNEDDGWQKGPVMRSFLQAVAQDGSGWPTTIIAIDDNLFMLQNMEQVAGELGIPFFGIHYQPPRITTFWVFDPGS
ncbi:MAG: DUF2608 domain-containing protein [Puniceicoccales bacterium]|jgi:hypothetical protein|nr:DUF2608 domain-containing protein [Puniceicoccales bacterium]